MEAIAGEDVGAERIEERVRRRERVAIRAAKAGDWEGVHFLYARYADRVCDTVEQIVGDHHAAQDVTQEIFARLLRAIRCYEPRDVPFSAWIRRVARNAAIDHLRTRRQIPVDELHLADRTDPAATQHSLEALKHSFGELPESQRQVMVLRYFGGYSPGEIAVRLDRSESSVHALHHRGRRQVKDSLRSLGTAPVTLTV